MACCSNVGVGVQDLGETRLFISAAKLEWVKNQVKHFQKLNTYQPPVELLK